MHKHGLAPKLHASFKNGLCYGFIAGTPFTTNCVLEEKKWRSVAKEMATLHSIEASLLFESLIEYYFINLLRSDKTYNYCYLFNQ